MLIVRLLFSPVIHSFYNTQKWDVRCVAQDTMQTFQLTDQYMYDKIRFLWDLSVYLAYIFFLSFFYIYQRKPSQR